MKATQLLLDLDGIPAKRCMGPCGVIKPLTAFYTSAAGVGGRRSRCQDCFTAAGRRRYAEGPRRQKMLADASRPALSLPGETWKAVPGFEGFYDASDKGRIRSLNRTDVRGHFTKGVFLNGSPDPSGRLRITLWRDGIPTGIFVHQVIMLTFVGPPPPGQLTRHGPNGIRDNSLANLCYGTPWENMHDKLRDGTQLFGEEQWNAKLTATKVREARALYAAGGWTQAALATRYGVSVRTMGKALRGEKWAHVENAQSISLRPSLNSKLTDDDVREIRRLHAAGGVSHRQLGLRFGVTRETVRDILNGKRRSKVA